MDRCPHCARCVDTLTDFMWNEGETMLHTGPACEDCIRVLMDFIKQKYVAVLN